MRVNRFREALKENANLLGMAGMVALSAALLTPIPLFFGIAAEAAYLLFVPDSKWYEVRLSKRFDAEVETRRRQLKEKVFPTLRPDVQSRFERLEVVRSQITTQAQEDPQWFREVLRKLDYLLEKFLLFAGKEVQFRTYLESLLAEVRGAPPRVASVPDFDIGAWTRSERRRNHNRGNRDREDVPRRALSASEQPTDAVSPSDSDERRIQEMITEVQGAYERERERILQLIEKEQDADTKAILEKRADVMQRRCEFVGKMGKILANLNHQLSLVEETFGLINDEIRARSPEQILADIDEVVVATDSMTQTLEELAPYEQLASRLSV